MEPRANPFDLASDGYNAVLALEAHVQSAVPPGLLELVKLRASILNGCVFCIDMHATDALKGGEDQRRLMAVAAWHEVGWFSGDERAALALTDAVTRLDGGVGDTVWNDAVARFGQAGAVELTLAVATINVWNRLAVTTRAQPPALA